MFLWKPSVSFELLLLLLWFVDLDMDVVCYTPEGLFKIKFLPFFVNWEEPAFFILTGVLFV